MPLFRRDHQLTLLMRADRAREAGEWHRAARLYRKALDRNPKRADIWVQYGDALKESGSVAEAESAYRAAMVRDSVAAEPHLQLGHLLKLQGHQEKAQAAYLRALALQPSNLEAIVGLKSLGWPEPRLAELRQTAATGDRPTPSEHAA